MGKDTEGRRCVPWVMIYLACLLAFCTEIVDCIILPPIHWNASNPMFKTSNNDHVIQVNMFDELDFICPTFNEWEESSQFEYYIIYQVSRKEYEDCYIYPETRAIMIVNCSSPNQRKRFTLLFEPFASIPHVPEFKKGDAYYYISTSTGHRDGIANVRQGACLYRNMKLTISVCCEDTTTPNPPINVTMVTNGTDPPPTTPHIPPVTMTTQDRINATTTTTTTTVATTTTTRRATRRPTTLRPTQSTSGNSIKYTDKELDRTSHKPTDKEKDNGDQNNVNKGNMDPNSPKQEGQVNKSRTLIPSSVLSGLLCLSALLSWLRR